MLASLVLAFVSLVQVGSPDASARLRPVLVGNTVEFEREVTPPADTESTASDSLSADSAAADPIVEAELPDAPTPAEAEIERGAPPQLIRYSDAATGLVIDLPPGWSETLSVSETELPAYARYSFAAASGSPLAGTTLHVERLAGLNALDRERWTRGLTPYGYHGLRPVGPLDLPVPGLGIELKERGSGGAVAFVQRGQTFWAVHVQAPEAVWSAYRAEAIALLGAVRLP